MKKLPRSLTPPANFLARHSAIIALALFAVVGAAVFDDYGVTYDEKSQRDIGYASFNYILGDEDARIVGHHDRFYGIAVEVPLIAVERLLGLKDSRDILLSRHLIAHLFFLAGGFFAWLLAYRLFGSRLIALLAMLLFLLHPRLYAHSFFNSKDPTFLSMFMIALYLIHRAFRRDTVWAFALCGAGVGLLVNIRIMGLTLIPAVLGMLALDAFYAMKRGGGVVKHILANIFAFSTICAATLYAAWPLLWREPLGAIEALGTLAQHPTKLDTLFRGETVLWPDIPWDYIPTWILITTPPVAPLLAALGIAYLARLCAVRPRDALANSTARYGLLALACLTLPVAAAVALNANLYTDWRHMYFLYAPLCVLAAFGLRALADIPRPNLRAAAFAAATLGIVAAAVQMVHLHPHQNDYFNSLVDKSGLAGRWEMDYSQLSLKEALETLLAMQPNGPVTVLESGALRINMMIIPESDRRRLHINPNFPSFSFGGRSGIPDPPGTATVWTREIYGVPIVTILDRRAKSEADHRAAYAAARASEPVASAGGFDIYADEGEDGGALTYVKDGCGEEDARGRFALSIFPLDQSDLPKRTRSAGLEYESMHFDFHDRGAVFDGGCVIVQELPDYPISHIETWRYMPGESPMWSALILLEGHYERYRRALASLSGEQPAIRSDFDVYVKDGALTYVKEGCGESDARGRFFLSVFPADQDDLPQVARDAGLEHEPLNFDFKRDGAIFDGKCVVVRDLPDYPISYIETGQWLPGAGGLWSARILFDAYYQPYRDALASLSGQPAMRSDFDVYMEDGALTYVKAPCGEADARGRFFLSAFPADPDDLPQWARDAGLEHEPLNFDFAREGAIFDGKCVIIRDLPDYPISRIETGQWTAREGGLWSGEILFDGYYERYRRALASLAGEPAMRSDFDIYLENGRLIYVKTHCSEPDARGRFFLSVFPADPSDLSQDARDAGFAHEPLNFDFAQYGAIFDGKCVIIRNLPRYPISRVETGQWLPGEGELWSGRIEVGD